MKLFKLIVGSLIVIAGLYLIIGEQLQGASGNASINAQLTTIRAPIAGRIELVPRTLGGRIARNDPLGSINDAIADSVRLSDLVFERDQTSAEIERLVRLTASLTEAIKVQSERASAYLTQRKNQLLAQERSANALVAAAEARFAFSESALSRASRLSTRGAATAESAEQTRSLRDVALQELHSARAKATEIATALRAANSGVFLGDGYNDAPYSEQRISELEVQRLELEAQIASKTSVREALDRRIDEERLRVNSLSSEALTANVDGVVWEYLSASGETVVRGQEIARLLDCDTAVVTLSVSESLYNTLRVGTSATFRLSGDNRVMEGTVARLAGSGAATVYQNLAVAPSEQHLQRYDVLLDVPALREISELRCLIGRSGRVFFDGKPFDSLRRLWS
ncbi:HlyD family secretion protein [Pararhizobium arenae]|uniref:HlyD family secretion protein n=1 Tax=Pararhizobium arenae TaxID=1856850 RepID=UPI00094AAF8A|nr:HlyD family efflux transporter periplasmic adaptor subunit [Pararhizobium arenae]